LSDRLLIRRRLAAVAIESGARKDPVLSATRFEFGVYELDVAAYELRRAGRPVKLERRPMELLLLLVSRRGELVTRDEILSRIWGHDVFLEVDNSINTAVAKIRGALRDDPDSPQFIKTVPGKGYRFIAPVTGSSPAIEPQSLPLAPSDRRLPRSRGRLWTAAAAVVTIGAVLAAWGVFEWRRRAQNSTVAPPIQSLAVLPLENLTGDAGQEYFADGMTDALITNLAQLGAVRVISRTSVTRYKGVRKPLPEIARELGVDAIVEGTVTRSAGRVRITSQLIYAPRDQHLWARSYERSVGDVIALQAEIAQAIVREVRGVLTPEQRGRLAVASTTDADAYEAYLKGRYYWNQRTPSGVKKSIEFFERAAERDPNFAPAYAGLADAYNFSSILGVLPPEESSPEAKAAATRALVLNPHLSEAHAALGLVKSHYDFDLPGAQQEFLRAIELNANNSGAHLFYAGAYLTPMGRHDDAIEEMRKALELDPLSLPLNNMMAETYLWAGDYRRSLEQFQRTIDLDPTFALAHFMFADALTQVGRFEDAIDERERGDLLLGAATSDATAGAEERRRALRANGPAGYWHKNLEIVLAARSHADHAYVEAIQVAGAYARAGDRTNALKWLRRAYEDREGQHLTLVRWLPEFESLRADTQFVGLLARMGLPH
jgi:TolB-like protein/DNA-binding winged helix-turn-helix (wHTH) protein